MKKHTMEHYLDDVEYIIETNRLNPFDTLGRAIIRKEQDENFDKNFIEALKLYIKKRCIKWNANLDALNDAYPVRLGNLITEGKIKEVYKLPEKHPIYMKGEAYWCGLNRKIYTVLEVNYESYRSKDGIYWKLKDVKVEWEDHTIETHCRDLNPLRDYMVILFSLF